MSLTQPKGVNTASNGSTTHQTKTTSPSIMNRLTDRFRTLFRSVGLALVTFRQLPEPPKVLVNRSRKLALARSAIHVLPSAVSITLAAFNIMGFFIGDQLQGVPGQDEFKMGLLQIAAKLQEMLIIGSLTTIVMHMLRSQLLFGDGLPLGLIVSGWEFTSLGYFWSPDFWGGILSKETQTKSRVPRLFFILTVVLAGFIALFSGPATAVLMIPRQLDFPVGGGIFWLNGSEEQLWPTYLDADHVAEWNCSTDEQRLQDPKCHSAGFNSLYSLYTSWWGALDAQFAMEVQDAHLKRKEVVVYPPEDDNEDTWAVTSHEASSIMLDAVREVHLNARAYLSKIKPSMSPFPQNLWWATSKAYKLKGKIPAARVACSAQGSVDDASDQIKARFAVLPELGMVGRLPSYHLQDGELVMNDEEDSSLVDKWEELEFDEVDVWKPVRQALSSRGIARNSTGLDRKTLFNDARRVVTVPVSIWSEAERGSSVGLVILHSNSNSEIHLTTCSVDARWVMAKTIIEAVEDNGFLKHSFDEGKVANPVKVELAEIETNYGSAELELGPIPTDEESDGPPTTIQLTPAWFNVFAPVLSTSVGMKQAGQMSGENGSSRNQTTLEILLQASPVSEDQIGIREIEATISSAVVDGLSRTGLIPNDKSSRFIGPWDQGYDDFDVVDETLARKWVRIGGPKELFPEPTLLRDGGWDTTRMVMKAHYHGYAMQITSWFDALCVTLVLAHVLIAIAHTIWTVWYCETSSAWGSILELVALAAKSPTPEQGVLENTSAGVDSFMTVGSVAWVESHAQTQVERLRLRFKGDQAGRDRRLVPQVQREYDRVVLEATPTAMSSGMVRSSTEKGARTPSDPAEAGMGQG